MCNYKDINLEFGIGIQLCFVKKSHKNFRVWDGPITLLSKNTIRDETEGLGYGYIFVITKFKGKNLVLGIEIYLCCKKFLKTLSTSVETAKRTSENLHE